MKSVNRTRSKLLGLGISVWASLALASGVMGQGGQPEPKKPVTPAPAPEKKAEQPAEALPKGEEIMDRYVKETGGKEAYEAIKSIVMTGRNESPMMKGTSKVYVVRPNKMLLEMNIEGMGEVRSGSDGETAWSDNKMLGPRILEGSERDLMMEDARVGAEANWRERYTSVVCTGVEAVGEKPAYKVELITKDGTKRAGFFDKESGLMVKQSVTAQTPMGAIPLEIFISDYKKVGDLVLPHKTTTKTPAGDLVSIQEKIEFNVEVPDSKFELPAEIKALKEKKAKKAAEPKPVDSTPVKEPKAPEKK